MDLIVKDVTVSTVDKKILYVRIAVLMMDFTLISHFSVPFTGMAVPN